MALFKIHKGDSANLDAQSRVEGYCWFTPDTGHFFIDTADARVPINATMYGVCNTAADTATKIVDITGFRLYTGARVTVKFTYASGVANSTLNVNGTGAKNMVRYGTTAIGNSSTLGWAAGAIQTFTYDGTSWVADYWHNTTYSNVSLGHGYATCSTAAATAAKTATLSSYSLTKGGIVAVKFTYAVPANATLNINSKGAKNIYYRGAKIVAGIINAGDTALFMYDGTQYQFLAKDYANATTTTAGLMSAADKAKLDGIASGATANTGDITGVTAGVGLAGGATSGSATVKAKLRSETALTIDSAAATTTTGRVYPVAVDKTGYLAVNVPWSDTNTDTGATSVEVTGSGNAITSASYDASTRKLTLTKGATYNNFTYSYTLPVAKYNTLGGIKPAYSSTGAAVLTTTAATNTSTPTIAARTTTAGRYYAVEVDKNGVAFVNVPWSDTNTNTTYSAGTGLSLNETTFNHSNSITAGSVGSAQSPSHGGTFAIPKITYDAQGHITGATTVNITLPADNNTDTKVTQTARTTNGQFPILVRGTSAGTSDTTTTTSFRTNTSINLSTGLITEAGVEMQRKYGTLIPYGTNIPANANLNTTAYLKVGNYYQGANATVATFTNCPTTNAFMMQVLSPLSTTIDNETTGTWVYRLRILQTYTGPRYVQYVYSGATAGTFTYGAWTHTVECDAGGTVGGTTTPVYVSGGKTLAGTSYAKAIKSITRSGTTFTYTCIDGTTGTFTQQDNNTTYSAGTGLTLNTSNNQFYVTSANVSTMMNLLGEGTSPAELNDYLIAQYAGGGTSTITYHRRKVSNVVNATVVKAALGTGTGTTKYLREDGQWVQPPNTTYAVATQSANGLMSKDDKFKLDNTNVAYGTCDTAADTAAKVVTLSGNTQWKLTNGAIIMVKFTNTNSASSVTLNVNSTGAYPIWYSNAEYTSTGTAYTGYAGRTITYMFNGTHWVWISGSYDANTQSNTNSTNTSSKIYLVGATSQGSNKTTYSHDTAYVGTDGHLYSNNIQVVNLSDPQALTNKTYNGYTLAAACAKGVATSVASGNTNLVTSGAVYTAIQNSVTSVNGLTGAVTLKFIYGNANYTLRLNDNATDRTGALAVKDANDKNVWILLNTTTAGVLQYQWYDSNGSWVNQANLLHTKNYTDYCAKASHTHSYLPLAGGTVTGEVTSSANVATSSAAFRNIKVIAPGTEVVVGTTAIPTGELWVRYEE